MSVTLSTKRVDQDLQAMIDAFIRTNGVTRPQPERGRKAKQAQKQGELAIG